MEFPIENQEAFDAAIKERLARERKKVEEQYSDYADLKAENQRLKDAADSGKSDLEDALKQVSELKEKDAQREAAQAQEALKAKIAKEAGVPVELVAGSDEEAMRSFAQSIAAFAKPKSAPKVPKSGSFTDDADLLSDKQKLAKEMFSLHES